MRFDELFEMDRIALLADRICPIKMKIKVDFFGKYNIVKTF